MGEGLYISLVTLVIDSFNKGKIVLPFGETYIRHADPSSTTIRAFKATYGRMGAVIKLLALKFSNVGRTQTLLQNKVWRRISGPKRDEELHKFTLHHIW